MRFKNRLRGVIGILLVLLLIPGQAGLQLHAQNQTTLLLALPKGIGTLITDSVLKEFEAANGNVQVQVVNSGVVPNVTNGLPAYFDAVQNYVNSADVVFVFSGTISPEATQAGYYLDLSPLMAGDKTSNPDDFYPQMIGSYQWDKGLWALPVAAGVRLLNYDPAAFDKAGLAYPDDKWTLADFTNAVDKLTVKDASGHVAIPALAASPTDTATLLRSLIGENLFDPADVPNQPKFDSPAAEAALDAFHKLDMAGEIGGNPNNAPLAIRAPMTTVNALPHGNTLLPGGKAGLDAFGFAISAGTQHPELAYTLINFLTHRADIAASFNLLPARQSIAAQVGKGNRPATIQAITDQAFANSLTTSDQRYASYLNLALDDMKTHNDDAKTALQAAETQATTNQGLATAQKSKLALAVVPPAAAPVVPAGKISITFEIAQFDRSQDVSTIKKLAQDFAASDPQVGLINLVTNNDPFDKAAAHADCFYMPYNAVPSANLSEVVSLDPYLSADASFDKTDLIGNVAAAIQREGKTWAIPIQIQPMILQVDSDQFKQAGLTLPTNDWTIESFIDDLKVLKAGPKGTAPFVPRGGLASGADGTDLLLLIADYGGLPFDFRTTPTTINFTDPTTVTAIRQVLDLAKNGYMTYNPLGQSPDPSGRFANPDHTAAIYPDGLTSFTFQQSNNSTSSYKPILYPRGSKFSGVGYTLDTVYISAQSKTPEACYRWLMTLTQHPEIFGAMPVRYSVITSMKNTVNPDVLALYTQIDALLKDPNTISFESLNPFSISLNDLLSQYWLYQAFDSYVLNNGDLDSVLKDAEGHAKVFQDCTANLPVLGINAVNDKNAIRPLVVCAEKADSRLKPILDQLMQ